MVLLSQSVKRRFLSTCCRMDLLLENPLGYVGMMSLWQLKVVCFHHSFMFVCWKFVIVYVEPTQMTGPTLEGLEWGGVTFKLFESWFVGGALLLFFHRLLVHMQMIVNS